MEKLSLETIRGKMPMSIDGQTVSGDFPLLPARMSWIVEGYLCGKFIRKSPYKLEDFSTLLYIGRSNGYHQILADYQIVLVCRVDFKQ